MKAINTYITEKLVIGDNLYKEYNYYPKNKEELIKCIKERINKEGLGTKDKPLDLNDIDTSKVTNMSYLFDADYEEDMPKLSLNGYFDISDWDVSNVETMQNMFYHSKFNGDISKWDVSNVKNMGFMFDGSNFNGNISNWDVSSVKNMYAMFRNSKFTNKNGNISKWNVSNVEYMKHMFAGCPLQKNPPTWWYKKVNF